MVGAWLVPLLNLWDLGDPPCSPRSITVRSGRRRPRAARVRLPWELKLMMLVLFVSATTVLIFSIKP